MKAGDRVRVAPTVDEVGGRVGLVTRTFKDDAGEQRAMVRFLIHRVLSAKVLEVQK